jgi:aminoglycoside phosphotransferase family enzyme/predicted kinase
MPHPPDPDALLAWLAQPSSYPHPVERVEHVQTHISHVFLAGAYAYKLKKPVRFDFVDFSTLAQREAACYEEVRLNRRLAPHTYLDVVPVRQSAEEGFAWRGDGPVVEWLVQMRRLPAERTLAELHRRGSLTPEHIDALAARLAEFYRQQPPRKLSGAEYLARCRRHVQDNRRVLLGYVPDLPSLVVHRVHGAQLLRMALRPQWLMQRVAQGRIVEGHGDLRPEHICFTEPLEVFDCLEFSAELRQLDVADELAFLMAECDSLGASWVGPRLWEAFHRAYDDTADRELLAFYQAYRACVRAKVAALRGSQLSGAPRQAALAQARAYLAWADAYAAPLLAPWLLVVGGVAGSGKSTLAAALAEHCGAAVLRTDVVRRQRFSVIDAPPPGAASPVPPSSEELYTSQARQEVYEALFRQAAAWLAQKVTVILDGTFSTAESIQGVLRLQDRHAAFVLAIQCDCPPDVARQRIAQRHRAGHDASQAEPEVHDVQRRTWQPWPHTLPQIRLDTCQPLEAQVATVCQHMAEREDRTC